MLSESPPLEVLFKWPCILGCNYRIILSRFSPFSSFLSSNTCVFLYLITYRKTWLLTLLPKLYGFLLKHLTGYIIKQHVRLFKLKILVQVDFLSNFLNMQYKNSILNITVVHNLCSIMYFFTVYIFNFEPGLRPWIKESAQEVWCRERGYFYKSRRSARFAEKS